MRALSMILALWALFLTAGGPVAACDTRDADAQCDHDAGEFAGTVTQIDYARGTLMLRTPDQRHLRVRILPSTSVGGDDHDADDYHAITDLHVGSKIDVDASRRGAAYEAQAVEIRNR